MKIQVNQIVIKNTLMNLIQYIPKIYFIKFKFYQIMLKREAYAFIVKIIVIANKREKIKNFNNKYLIKIIKLKN